MTNIIEAFENLRVKVDIVKAKKGEKKKGNPRYKKTMKNGHPVYILVDKEDHPNSKPKLTPKEFDAARIEGDVNKHFVEPPTIRSLRDLRNADFVSERTYGIVDRALKRIAFYDKSIEFATAIGDTKVAGAHNISRNSEINRIDQEVTRDFNRKGFEGFDENDVADLEALGVSVTGGSETTFDYINNHYPNFDFKNLFGGIKSELEEARKSLEEKGLNTTEKWRPKMGLSMNSSGFTVTARNDGSIVKDKFGWNNNVGFSINRQFSGTNQNLGVYHALFVIGEGRLGSDAVNPLSGSGFAKNMMKNFHEQYKNVGMKHVTVTAAGSGMGDPYCGSNTWGRWGFQAPRSRAERMITDAKSLVSSGPVFVKTDERTFIHNNEEDVCTYLKNANGAISKVKFTPGESKDRDGRDIKVVIKTKKSPDGSFKSKVSTSSKVSTEDAEEMKRIFDEVSPETDSKFRMKEWYEGMSNPALRAFIREQWNGSINLSDQKQKDDFEENLYKEYQSPTAKEIAEFEKNNK